MAKFFLPNPGFELGVRDWDTSTDWSIVNDAGNARSGSWVGRLVGSSTNRILLLPKVSTRPGGSFDASLFAKDGTAGTARVRVAWSDADDVIITSSSGSGVGFGNPYTESTALFTAPDRAKFAQFGVRFLDSPTGTWFVDDLSVTGDLIEDIPAAASLSSYRIAPADTIGVFDPLIGPDKFTEFNAGMSDKWGGVFTFKPTALGGDLNSLLAFLRRVGQIEQFFAFDPDRKTPVNGVVNGMTVDGATTNGTNRIPVTGGPVSSTALVAGDYIEVKNQYFQLQRDLEIGPEGTGEAIVWPSVRSTLADGEDVITDNPKLVARITSDLDWARQAGDFTAPSISWEEV